MRLSQSYLSLACCVGGALLGACGSDGSYQVRWAFSPAAAPADPATAELNPGGCGKYGVSAIAIAAMRDDGHTDAAIVACAPGTTIRKVATGVWTLKLTALDAAGHVKDPDPDPTSALLHGATTVTVDEDQLTPAAAVVLLTPLPECRDGIDNDCDGRVDLDDPGCAGDRQGTAERGADLTIDPGVAPTGASASACDP
jgi:hypothetical protein